MSKELSDMSIEELWQLFPIVLEEHNSNYKAWYKIEEEELMSLINAKDIRRISHIGSSAVEGLIAKPTVDILLEIDTEGDFNSIRNMISESGWILMKSQEIPYKSCVFNKGYTKHGYAEKVYHLHMRYNGDWDELYFRDYLIDHKEVAIKYGELKLRLFEKYKHNRDGYTDAKTRFIKEHTDVARKLYHSKYSIKNK